MKTRSVTRSGGRLWGVTLAIACAAMAHACGDTPTNPTPPPPANSAPTVTNVTVSRTQLNAGEEVEVTATAQDEQTPAEQLQFAWSAQGGTFSGQGRSVRWRAPNDGPVPNDYILTVTVSDPGGLTGVRSSEAIRVNDGIREMRQLALTFIADFTTTAMSPELVVRNFTDSCPGKAQEVDDLTRNRRDYDEVVNVVPPVVVHTQLNSGALICTYPSSLGGRNACALVVTDVDWRSRVRGTTTYERVKGEAHLTGVFENRQWRLCDSRFFGSPATPLRRPFLH